MTKSLRTLPHDVDAEKALIGSLLIDPTTLPEVSGIVDAKAFCLPAAGSAFQAIQQLSNSGTPVDAVTILDTLQQMGAADESTADWLAERFKAIEAKHEGMVQTINARIAAATAKFSGAESARQALIDGVTDPALFAERDGLLSRLREIEGEQAEVHQRIASLDHVIGVNQRDDDGTDGIVAEQVQSRRDARERLRELSTEAEAVNARLVTFDRERMTSPDA